MLSGKIKQMLGGVAIVIFWLLLCNHVSNDVWNGTCVKDIKQSWMEAVIWNNDLIEAYHCSAMETGN